MSERLILPVDDPSSRTSAVLSFWLSLRFICLDFFVRFVSSSGDVFQCRRRRGHWRRQRRHCLSPSFAASGGAAAAARAESSWCQMAFTRVSVVAAADNFGVTVQPALYSGGQRRRLFALPHLHLPEGQPAQDTIKHQLYFTVLQREQAQDGRSRILLR